MILSTTKGAHNTFIFQFRNDDVKYSSPSTVDEEVKSRKRHSNAVKDADTTFLYAESKAAR